MEGLVTLLLLLSAVLFFVANTRAKERERATQEARLRTIDLSDIDKMDGLPFEHYIANLLKHEGFTQVEVTKGSGDFGVDVIALKSNCRYAIQVKRSSGTVSRRAVSDAVAGKRHYSCSAAMVVTNGYLSRQSKDFASSVGCEIIDRDILTEWIMRFQASGTSHQTVRRAADPLQQNLVSESRLPSQKPEDYDLLGVPSEVLMSIKSQVAADHHHDFATQEYIIKKQIEAYKKIGVFCAPDVPEEILSKILENTAEEHPADYSMQLFHLKQETDAYEKLEGYIPSDMPEDVFSKVKENVILDYPLDYSTQLYVLRNQTDSYQELIKYSPHDIPEKVFSKIKKQSALDYPFDFETQFEVIKEQVKSYRELAALTVQDVPAEKIAAIKEQATQRHPNDFETQLDVVKDKIKSFRALGRIK